MKLWSILIILSMIYSSQSIDLTPCVLQDWLSCGVNVGSVYFQLHRWNDYTTVTLFDRQCVGKVKGGFHSWQWKWSGEFSCLGWNIVGSSTQFKSRSGATEHAIIDFIQKALQAKLITTEQIKGYKELINYVPAPLGSGGGGSKPGIQNLQDIV